MAHDRDLIAGTPAALVRDIAMQIALVMLIALHALLHLLGFFKVFNLADLPALSGQTLIALPPAWSRLVGVLWLLACLVLLAAATLRALRLEPWWQVALLGVVLSQALTVLQWHDAKAGSAANLLIVLAIGHTLFAAAQRR